MTSGQDPFRGPVCEDAGVLDVDGRAGHPGLGARRQRHRLRRTPRTEEVQEEPTKVQSEQFQETKPWHDYHALCTILKYGMV